MTVEAILGRPTVLFDIDGVLAFWAEAACQAANAKFGLELDANDVSYHLKGDLDSAWLAQFCSTPVATLNISPDLHAIDAVQTLHDRGYVVVVGSDRPQDIADASLEWLNRWTVRYDLTILTGQGGKAKFAAAYGPDRPLIWVDDNPFYWLMGARQGVDLWHPARPWTPPQTPPPNVHVFERWSAFLDELP